MNTRKLLLPVLCLGLLVSSCSKDSTPSLTTDKAQAAISDVNTNLVGEIGDLSATSGNLAMNSLSGLTGISNGNPLGRIGSFSKPGDIKFAMKTGILTLRQMFLKATADERVSGGSFGFADKKGIYVYSFANKTFTKSQTASSIIQIQYPKDSLSQTNDAELQITKFDETLIGVDYYPTDVEAAIYIGPEGARVKQVGLVLTASGYDDTGKPNKVGIQLYINPFTFTFNFDDSAPNTTTESFNLSNNGTLLIATQFTAVFAASTDKPDSPSSVSGFFQLKSLRFNISVNGTKANISTSNNDFIVITVIADGAIAGHVVWVGTNKDDEKPYILYNDGVTKEALATVFQELITKLQDLKKG